MCGFNSTETPNVTVCSSIRYGTCLVDNHVSRFLVRKEYGSAVTLSSSEAEKEGSNAELSCTKSEFLKQGPIPELGIELAHSTNARALKLWDGRSTVQAQLKSRHRPRSDMNNRRSQLSRY